MFSGLLWVNLPTKPVSKVFHFTLQLSFDDDNVKTMLSDHSDLHSESAKLAFI